MITVPHTRTQLGWRMLNRRRAARSAAVTAALLLTAACGAGPVSVKRLAPEAAYRNLTANTLSTGKISGSTSNTLRRHDLLTLFQDDPERAISELRAQAFADKPSSHQLASLAETSFTHGMATADRGHFLAAALYAYALLFPGNPEDQLHPVDPRVRVAIEIYNAAIARGFISDDGKTVELKGGRYQLPFGSLDVTFDEDSLFWSASRLVDFIPANELEVTGLRNRYRRWGIGSPLAARTERREDTTIQADYVSPAVRIPVTAVLRIENVLNQLKQSELAANLELYTPVDPEEIRIGGHTVPLEAEPTATLAVGLAESQPWRRELKQFLGAAVKASSSDVQMMALEPAKTDSIPVIFVHGTYSSSSRWANMVNDLTASKIIRDRFDFYFFTYDSGNPIAYSGEQIRRELDELHKRLKADGVGECIDHMVVMGHSQGGLLTKFTAIDSGNTFWNVVSHKPFDEVRISKQNRELIRSVLFFEARPYVDRVVFMATPHGGSYLAASGFARRIARRLIAVPADLASLSADMLRVREDPDILLNMERVPTSIDNMSPGSTAIRTLSSVPIKDGIAVHSIIAVKNDGPLEDGVDGVVAYKSAHIKGVESEFIVRSSHSMQDNPHTIGEVQRILQLHAEVTLCGAHARKQSPTVP